MQPIRSNSNKENCSPISSNCVIWQGPDLICLNLCKGDSISDVVYKMAVEICDLKDNIGISDVDFTCLLQVCQTTPAPAQTLSNILNLLVSKVCCLSDIVKNLPAPGTNYVEPTLDLAACLRYSNGTGGQVTQLIHHEYTLRIATFLCLVNTQVNTHTSQIATNTANIATLMNATTPVLQVASCLLNSIDDIDVVLENLETQFCSYKTALGTVGDITTVSSRVCKDLSTSAQLSYPKQTMAGLTNWVQSPQNLGQVLQNLWLTVCDMRTAVNLILTTCCQVSCESISIKIAYKWIDANTLRLFFTGSVLPMGFYDCDQAPAPAGGTLLTLTDGLGNSHDIHVLLRNSDPAITDGILDDLTINPLYSFDVIDISSTTPLDVTTGLVITSDACFTNGDMSCIKCLTANVAAYVNKDCCTITATVPTTITYKICYSSVTTTTTTAFAP